MTNISQLNNYVSLCQPPDKRSRTDSIRLTGNPRQEDRKHRLVARTTGLYDRRGDEISLDEIERIAI